MRRLALVALFLSVGCATAGEGVPGTTADADPSAPDAPPGSTPDADPSNPPADAMVSSPPDAMVAAECTLVLPQTGCPMGQACDLDGAELSTGGTECRNVNVAGTETSTCTTLESCAAGYTCLGAGTDAQCYKFCATDSHCNLTAGGLCTINIVYGTPPMDVPGGLVCSKACDPLSSTGCPPAFGCHVYQEPVGTAERFFTHCSAAGGGGQEATCTDDTDCQANYTCVTVGGTTSKCLKNCRYTPPVSGCAGLPAGNQCVRFTNEPTIGGVEYGVCFDGT